MQISNISAQMPRVDYHVVPAGKLWAVKAERSVGYSGLYQTKVEATSYAIQLARMAASSVVIHNRQGVIRDVWSYSHSKDTPRIMA